MKVRILWVAPHERHLKCGKVYDLPEADAQHLVDASEAETVKAGVEAEEDPRPEAIEAREAAAVEAAADKAVAKAVAKAKAPAKTDAQ
jgi:hypothetical protein